MPKASDITGNIDDDAVAEAIELNAELTVDRKTGRVRQAGAVQAEGKFVLDFKKKCEEDLYCFCDGVLNYWFLYAPLHKAVCDWLTTVPPYRKMLLMPRNHGKSTLVGRALPLHVLIQPAESNLYFRGPGTDLRLVIAGETVQRAEDHMRVIIGALQDNVLLRALWPHVTWDNPRRQSSKWSTTEIVVPRATNFPDPTIRAIGWGGAITGAHPNMLIKDDLTTETAANEPTTMQGAIDWHRDSRALFANPDVDLEFITGTYWAAYDLPNWIEQNDHTVQVNTDWRQIVTPNGKVIYPTKYGYPGAIEQLQHEHGVKFPLLFMNTVIGSTLTDFLVSDLRFYTREGDNLIYQPDMRDDEVESALNPIIPDEKSLRGMKFHDVLDLKAVEYLRNCRGG